MQRFRIGDRPPKTQATKDPNVLTLSGSNKIRLVDTTGAGTGMYEQHIVQSLDDENQVFFVVCPGRATCPLCRKPVARDDEGKEVQLFPRSVRYITNVWDYGTNTIKVLIGGPQIFKEFEQAQENGIDPTGCDWTINKQGKGIQTKYIVVRDDASPFAFQDRVTPDALHDIDKYGNPTSPEKIFEILEKAGWDYDAIPAISFTTEQALGFVLPFGECKGMTVEQALAQNQGWCEWLHSQRLEDEQIYDPVFLALDKAMKDRGIEVGEFEEAATQSQAAQPAPEEAVHSPEPTPPASNGGPQMVALIDPSGNEIEVPPETVDNLLQAGFQRKPEPEPDEDPDAEVALTKDGVEITVPASAAAPLEAAGYVRVQQQDDGPPDPAQPREVTPEPVFASTAVQVNVSGTTLPLPFKNALDMVRAGTEVKFLEENVAAYAQLLISTDGEPPEPGDEPQSQAEAQLHQEGQEPTLESAAAEVQAEQAEDPEKPFKCDQCGWAGKTQGALTQHKKREHDGEESQEVPAAGVNGGGREAALEELKRVLTNFPESKYKLVMQIFGDEVGKRNITEFTQEDIEKVLPKLKAELANLA